MTSLESILKNFYFEKVNENKFPKFGKPGRQQYLFTCKRCNSTSEPMHMEPDVKYRLVSHLLRFCRPSSINQQQEQEEATNEQ